MARGSIRPRAAKWSHTGAIAPRPWQRFCAQRHGDEESDDFRACRARAGAMREGLPPLSGQIRPRHSQVRTIVARTPCTRARTERAAGRGAWIRTTARRRPAKGSQLPLVGPGSEPRGHPRRTIADKTPCTRTRRRAAVILARVGRAPAAATRDTILASLAPSSSRPPGMGDPQTEPHAPERGPSERLAAGRSVDCTTACRRAAKGRQTGGRPLSWPQGQNPGPLAANDRGQDPMHQKPGGVRR
jgi:hypothetical protein